MKVGESNLKTFNITGRVISFICLLRIFCLLKILFQNQHIKRKKIKKHFGVPWNTAEQHSSQIIRLSTHLYNWWVGKLHRKKLLLPDNTTQLGNITGLEFLRALGLEGIVLRILATLIHEKMATKSIETKITT